MKRRNILDDARSAPSKESLEPHREAITLLRNKGYSWRDVAEFLAERGVNTDHTAVFRFVNRRGTMATVDPARPYNRVRKLVELLGGDMRWIAGGGPGGGKWKLAIGDKVTEVRIQDRSVNDLDRLYVAKVPNPKTWDDYDHDAPFLPDACWQFIRLFEREK